MLFNISIKYFILFLNKRFLETEYYCKSLTKKILEAIVFKNKLYDLMKEKRSVDNVNIPILIINLKDMTNLSIKDKNIQSIIPDAFRSFSKLKNLDLSRNQLKHFQASNFSYLENLDTLCLSENHMESLRLDAFEKLGKLQKLNISRNQIKIFN